MTAALLTIREAFPKLKPGFFVHLKRLIIEDNFTNERLKDSINHVMKTCLYPEPTIANFLSFDNRIKLYTYREVVAMTDTNRNAFEDYKLIESLDRYASTYDIKKYNL